MFQRWIEDLTSRPGAVAVLFGVMALLLGIYIWSATEVRRSHERRMRRIRDTLYISTALLGQLTIQENRNYERSEHEHDDLITAMLACKAASYLSPQLQDQIRDCIKDHDPARIGLMHRALERECTVLSDELSRETHADHWGTAVWAILRPVPAAPAGHRVSSYRSDISSADVGRPCRLMGQHLAMDSRNFHNDHHNIWLPAPGQPTTG